MVKKAALKTAGITMAGFQPRKKVFDGQTAEPAVAAPDAAKEPGRTFTGVGSVMAAITREAEISQELIGAQARLEQANVKLATYEGAELVRALDPRAVCRSQWANRLEAEFSTPEFQLLKEEIVSAGGNVQPIKVRALQDVPGVFDGQTPTHEIVFGHRRHQACLELGLPVHAIVVERMDDKSLFEAMDRENRGRKNLSPWEQGRMYDQAIKQGLYPSLRRLSESLGVNLSDASRAVQLAKLPKEVVAAFKSPLDLQVRWAKPLVDALQRDPDGVLKRARACAAQASLKGPAEVFGQLIGTEAKAPAQDVVITEEGQRLAIIRQMPNGKSTIEFEAGVLTEQRRTELLKLVRTFMSPTTGATKPRTDNR